jgi:hypothetical protein
MFYNWGVKFIPFIDMIRNGQVPDIEDVMDSFTNQPVPTLGLLNMD